MTTNQQPQRYGGLLGVAGGATMFTVDFMAPADDVVAAFVDDSSRILAGSQLAVIGFLLLAAFGAVLHRRISAAAPDTPLAVMAVSGYVFTAVVGMSAAGAFSAGALRADEDGTIAPTAATAVSDFASVMIGGAVPAGLALGVAATALAALRYGVVIPRWLAWIGVPLAVGLVILPINYLVLPFGVLWTIGVGVSMSWNPRPVDTDTHTDVAAPAMSV